MRRVLEAFRGLGMSRTPSSVSSRRVGRAVGSHADWFLHHRRLRIEWLEDRSLLNVAPTAVDLLPVSDTGIFNDDNLTNLDNSAIEKVLQFEVSGTVAGATVTLYADGVAIGSTVAAGETTTVVSDGDHDLADGGYAITARQTEPASPESPDSSVLEITIDTVAPDAPAAPDLDAASDTGISSTDNYTKDNTPTFLATGSPYFRLYRFTTQISGDYESGTICTATPQPDGTYDYTIRAVDAAGNESGPSPSLSVTLDTASPIRTEQIGKVLAGDSAASDYFGESVSISGDMAIVGAYCDDDRGSDSGSAYIFNRTGSGWTQVAKLRAGDGAADDSFGFNVSISGFTAVVGAHYDDDNGSASGSAYVFENAGSGWMQVAKLTAADGAPADFFGSSVSISGSMTIVGAQTADPSGGESGAAYLFENTGSSWVQVAKLAAADGTIGDHFGYSVSISDNTALIGACYDDDSGADSGSAYSFGVTHAADVADLQAASDTGADNADNVTSDVTPTFEVNTPGCWFQIYRNGVKVTGDFETGTTYTDSSQPDGTYEYAVVAVDAAGNESLPSDALTVTIDTQTPSAPVAPDLLSSSDSGMSNSDDLTNDGTPTFSAIGAPYFRLYSDGVLVSGSYEMANCTAVLQVDDERQYTATAVDAAGNESAPSVALAVTIDTIAPPVPAALDLQSDSDTGASDSDNVTSDCFGCSVSIDDNRIIVGAFRDNDNGIASGSAYVFDHVGSGWIQRAKLLAEGRASGDYFGTSVSISDAVVCVGASSATGVGPYTGAAYVFSTGPRLADDTGASADDQITSDSTPSLVFVFSEPVFGQDTDVTVLDPNGNAIEPDAITGWGTNSLVVSFTSPLTVNGPYALTLEGTDGIADAAGNPLNGGVDETVVFTLDTVAPSVTQVLVKGSTWTDAFLDWLDAHGLGHPSVPRLGYRLPGGGEQFNTLRWDNIDTVTIVFSKHVVVAQDHLAVVGMNASNYSIAGLSYDPANHATTWMLASPIDADRLLVAIADVVADLAGNRLDGEWQNGASSFPSGDGAAGGHFTFAVNVLPGDVNRDTVIDAADASILATVWGYAGPSWAPADVNGDLAVNATDAVMLAAHWGTRLPAWLPGDADYSGTIDAVDARILAANWGRTGMTWTDGDFNCDGMVNATDAAILAANFGTTLIPSSERVSPHTLPRVESHMVAMTPFVGPLPIGNTHETRQPIRPVERFGEGGFRPSEQLGTHQRAYAVRSPMLSIEETPESSAAVDAVLAEAYGPTIEPPTFLNHHLRRRIIATARKATSPGAFRP